ncbi:OVARIAN TUMOR DOMAIN-containing deubiquitinating enzyme 7 isoform X3 [Prosopis cineraria]|uniref:OVARIAN TUMOR DOMAIN-containing deubiquitinating enzyme 7 isoform X3 n=1 Tax=Prosopis cineraria TaxID=364024 RepID=UPI00240F47C5|nr:OVARIAN TUMOR DOMAIN-containing deubiquitinating enzyme 7 isoform X3 [Prosopis cineraria]
MVKPKQQKPSKKSSHPHAKKQGKQVDISQLRSQLDMLGLRIIEVTADGNCFFRALADQLEGNEEEHQNYRSMVVKHIMDNREMFEPFIEDEVPFDEYCQSMQNDGTWAGHMELQAASLVTHSNICIHRNMSPRWYIRNFNDRGAHMIHLSYHDGEHYNSVRLKNDPGDGHARPIVIKADADLSATSHQAKLMASESHWQVCGETFQSGSIKLVMAGSGCENAEKVEQILEQVNGDVGAAIEFLIAEHGTEESSTKSDSPPSQDDASVGDENKNKEYTIRDSPTNDESNNSSTKINGNSRLQRNDKKIPRNKVCPCGSKKKYKSCCGTALGGQAAKLVVNQAADTRKGRKEKKQGKKSVPARADVISECDNEGTLDMGALCI